MSHTGDKNKSRAQWEVSQGKSREKPCAAVWKNISDFGSCVFSCPWVLGGTLISEGVRGVLIRCKHGFYANNIDMSALLIPPLFFLVTPLDMSAFLICKRCCHESRHPMKKIAILSQKGGTGKTYFSTNLSVAAQRHGQTTVLVDLDPQSSSAKWGDTRAEDTPAVISTHAERLPKMLQLAAENGASVAVIDTAPHTQAAALEAARAADLVIIPCKPDLVSIQAIGTTINLVHLAKVPARIVLNGVTHYGNLAKQAREGLSIYDIPCAPCQIGDRIAFVHAYNAGYGVIEFQPRSKASREITALYKYILRELEA